MYVTESKEFIKNITEALNFFEEIIRTIICILIRKTCNHYQVNYFEIRPVPTGLWNIGKSGITGNFVGPTTRGTFYNPLRPSVGIANHIGSFVGVSQERQDPH